MKKAAGLFLSSLLIAATAFSASAEVKVNEVYATHGMVSAANELASKAGVEVMKKGGNAVDAAVATALALNVVEFNASGIGGGGFMTIRDAKTGKTICLDYRETAPASATKDMYASEQSKKDKWSIYGGKSVAVPGWLKGMTYALDKYGTMKFKDVAAPAIRLAEEGFVVAPMQNGIITDNYSTLVKFSGTKLPYFKDELPLEAGQVLKQPALGKLFRLIGEKGPDVFYKGPVADAIVKAVDRTGGKMTKADLAGYKMFELKPIIGTYRGYKIYSMPPSSSGGTHIVQLLNMMENYDVKALKAGSEKFAHIWAEATKLAFADRSKYMADTAFVKVPLNGLQSKEYAKELVKKIDETKVADKVEAGDPWKYDGQKSSSAYTAGLGSERQSTSSFSVVDAKGTIVTSTNTINYFCGSSVFVPEYGFLLNDEMDDFSQNPESVNAPEPGKRPLSSMSPTIVLDPQGRPFMSIGAAGATRIITAVSQIIMNVIDHNMAMDEAIEQGRFHNQSGTLLRVDEGRMNEMVLKTLEKAGYKIEQVGPGTLGTAQGILFDNEKGRMNGGADSRRLGVPVGF